MRNRKHIGILIVLTLLASMSIISLPPTSAQSQVVFRVEPNVQSGVTQNGNVTVDVYIDAPADAAIIGWALNVKVNPSVLLVGYTPYPWIPPIGSQTGLSGYFLYDWCYTTPHPNWPNGTIALDGEVNRGAGTIIGITESVKAWKDIPQGEGAGGTGKLVTILLTSDNADLYSPIEITDARYYTTKKSPELDPNPAAVIPGHYNDPTLDVAVTSVSAPTPTSAGVIVDINVAVANLGDPTATNLALTYDGTSIETRIVTLTSLESRTEVFSWDTTGVAPGDYTITAEIILEGDPNLGDNVGNTPIKIAVYRIDLIRHSAWARTDNEEIELYAIIRNVGTEATQGKVVFTITDAAGIPRGMPETTPQPLAPGEKYGDGKDTYSTPWTAPMDGKYYVSAEAWYQDSVDVWQKSPDKPKTFAFRVTGLE